MIPVGSRLRQIGWAVVLSVCAASFMALTFRVNAVKSEVRLAERQIIALEKEKILLETEFETRANQQQLADWNRIEFGYAAPSANQYLDNERQLVALGVPRHRDAPDPIRVARARVEEGNTSGFLAMVSPVASQEAAGKSEAAAPDDADDADHKAVDADSKQGSVVPKAPAAPRRSLAERLGMDVPLRGVQADLTE